MTVRTAPTRLPPETWIPCADMMPADYATVLVWADDSEPGDPDGWPELAWWIAERGAWWSAETGRIRSDKNPITFWCPIPGPPWARAPTPSPTPRQGGSA